MPKEQPELYTAEQAEDEATKMQDLIEEKRKEGKKYYSYSKAERKIEAEKAKEEAGIVLGILEKKANGEELSKEENSVIFEVVQSVVRKSTDKLSTVKYNSGTAYDPETREKLSEKEAKKRELDDFRKECKLINPFFESVLEFVKKKHQETGAAQTFASTIESYLDSADEFYKKNGDDWFSGIFTVEYYLAIKNAREQLRSGDDLKISKQLSELEEEEQKMQAMVGQYNDAKTKRQQDEIGRNIRYSRDKINTLVSILLGNKIPSVDQFNKASQELSEDEKKFILAAIGAKRENGLKNGFTETDSKDYIYSYYIGYTGVSYSSIGHMDNLKKIGLKVSRGERGSGESSLTREKLAGSMLSYMGFDDIKRMEEENIEKQEEEEKEIKFQEELKSSGFIEFIEKLGLKKEEVEFVTSYFRSKGDIPNFNLDIDDHLDSIKKGEDGEIVYVRQDYDTVNIGNNVVDNVKTLVLIGKGNALIASKIVDSRPFRTTHDGILGYGPVAMSVEEIKHETDKIKLILSEKLKNGRNRKINTEIEVGSNLFQTDPNFENNAKLIREEIDRYFANWMQDYEKRVTLPGYLDEKERVSDMARAGLRASSWASPDAGERKGRARVAGVEFVEVNKAIFRIFADHDYNMANEKIERRVYTFEIMLNKDRTFSVVEKGFKTEQKYLHRSEGSFS